MSIYSIIYAILAIALLIYAIRNRLDLLCIGTVCFIVYTIYCLSGTGISGFYRPKLSPKLYYLIYVQMLIIFIFSHLSRRKERKLEKNIFLEKYLIESNENLVSDKRLDQSFFIYTCIIVAFALVNVASIGFSGFASGKANVWQQSNILYIISLYGAYPSFAYGIHNNKKWIWIPSLLVELTIFFAGARAFIATIIIIFLCDKGTALWKNRKGNMKIFLLGAVAIVFLLVYRMIDKSIMSGDIKSVMNSLSRSETWLTALEFNEPRVIIANYDYVLTSDFRLPVGDIIYRFLDVIPGLNKLIPIKLMYPEYFSTWLQQEVHGSGGVGGTIWGEGYAMFGVLGVFLFTVIWLLIVRTSNIHLDFHAKHSYFIVSLGTYLAWYINRLDLNRITQVSKIIFFCYLLWAFIHLMLGGKIKIFKYELSLKKAKEIV